MTPTNSVKPRTPPTTPPAIAPVFELFCFGLGVDPEVDDADADVVAVLSGESLKKIGKKKTQKVRIIFCYATIFGLPPALCAAVAFHVSATCRFTTENIRIKDTVPS